MDPWGLARSSLDSAITKAASRGDVAELRTLLSIAEKGSLQRSAAKKAIDRLMSKGGDIVAKECKGYINRQFPGTMREKTLQEIWKLAVKGNKDARTAKKLLSRQKYKK